MGLDLAISSTLAALPPPVIVFNKSHSGSRLLAALLRGQGIFMGSVLNESLDALPFLPLVEHLVLNYYPDFQPLWRRATLPEPVQTLLAAALDAHLATHPPGAPWGWKLCETGYILPLLAALFPKARYLHLIRDGRDVAFCDHVAPEQPFWRKIYFGADTMQSWRGMSLTQATYERRSYLYNARHWQESVRVGRAFGAMLGSAYREVRYEALCADLPAEGRKLMEWLGLPTDEAALAALAARVDPSSIGKHRRYKRSWQRAVQGVVEPTLLACGYDCAPLPPGPGDRLAALAQRFRRRLARQVHG